jgi:hypothetical protein
MLQFVVLVSLANVWLIRVVRIDRSAMDDEKTAKLGVIECVKHELLRPFPVVYERPGEYIAQFKFTVLLLPRTIQKITFAAATPFVSSQYAIEDPKVKAILNMGLKRGVAAQKKKKTKPKAAAAAATTTTTTTAEGGDKMDTEN